MVLKQLYCVCKITGLSFLLVGDWNMWTNIGVTARVSASRRHHGFIATPLIQFRGGDQSSIRTQRSSHVASPSSEDRRHITFLTDVEGDRDYLTRYVEHSRVLRFRPTTPILDRTNNEMLYFPYHHCMDFQTNSTDCLVYGGDVWDQGGSDLYTIRQLLDLKARHPDRVFLVLGNRDINKMRVIFELGKVGEATAPPHEGVYWLRGSQRVGDPDLGMMDDDPVERLKWMLSHTMGSPRAFEHRRWELEQERLAFGIQELVQDMDVVESYRQSCQPIVGEMSRYLSQGSLAVRLGEALFLHGSLPLVNQTLERKDVYNVWDDLTFAMPWLEDGVSAPSVGVETIDDWLQALEDFVSSGVQAWKEQPHVQDMWSTVGGYNHPNHPYGKLVQYGSRALPGGVRNPTIVYGSWLDNGMPKKFLPGASKTDHTFATLTKDFLERSGVRFIFCGHQPQGDMPNVIRIELSESTAFVFCCDTSYSGDIQWVGDRQSHGRGSSRSGRGMVAVSEVLIEQCLKTGNVLDVMCHGVLSDGTPYETHSLGIKSGKELVVGTSTPQSVAPDRPWWTKALYRDGSVLLSAGLGFQVWNRLIRP